MGNYLNKNKALICAAWLASPLAAPAWAQTAPAAGAVLSYSDSYFADAQLGTAYDMVGRLPGFVFNDGNTARGYAGTAGNVLVDGQRPTSKTDDLQAILQRIPAERVARIDIIRGGAPGIDMQGLTVIANVVLKSSDDTSIVAVLANDLYGDGHSTPAASVEFNRRSGGTVYDATLSRIDTEQDDSAGDGTRVLRVPGQAPVSDGGHRRGAQKAGYGLNGSIATPVLDGAFGANLTLQETRYNSATFYDAPGAAAFPSSQDKHDAEFGAHWDGRLGAASVNLLALQRLERAQNTNASTGAGADQFFDSVSDTAESIVRGGVRYDFSPALTLEGGAEGAYNTLRGASSFLSNGVGVALPAANPRVAERRGEVYLQADWHIAPNLLAEAGSRFEYSKLSALGIAPRTLTFPKPRLLLSWSPDPSSQIRLRAERVVGQLDFSNFIASSDLAGNGVSAGNLSLRPDQRWQLEGAYEFHFWKKGALVFTYMHEDITDLVDYVPVGGGLDGPGNIKKAVNDQFDLELSVPTDRIALANGVFKASLLWDDSALTDPVTGRTRPISGVWDRKLQFFFTQDIESLDSTWGIGTQLAGSSEPYYRIAQVSTNRFFRPYLQLTWEYKPRPDLDLQLGLYNITPYGFEIEQLNYAGPRNSAPLAVDQDFRFDTEPRLTIQLRKTF